MGRAIIDVWEKRLIHFGKWIFQCSRPNESQVRRTALVNYLKKAYFKPVEVLFSVFPVAAE